MDGTSTETGEVRYDLFISYAHLDNEPLVEGEPGWVTTFHGILEKRLAMLLGEKPAIWRDRTLRGNDFFDDTIARAIRNARLLVSVLTPRYVRSDYCQKEIDTFFGAVEAAPTQAPTDKSRVFKVLKTPIPLDEHPPPIRQTLGYQFYETDPASQRIREFDITSTQYREQFIATLDDLAQEIKDLLVGLRDEGAQLSPREGPQVYVSTASSDLRPMVDRVRRDLLAQGCITLPDESLPLVGPELEASVARQLEGADLAIHMFGENYGVVPEQSDRSQPHIQLDVAASISEARGLPRLIWIAPDARPTDERQRALLARIESDAQVQRGAQVIRSSIENFQAMVRETLSRAQSPTADASEATEEGPPWVYLLHDLRDVEDVGPLVDALFDAGVEVRTPLFEGDQQELREEHESNLRLCDAFLVYYGHGGELWIRRALADLRRAQGLDRRKPIRGRFVWMGSPDHPAKSRYRTNEATVLRPGDAPLTDTIAPFLEALGRGGDR